jgi:eukaryotic-like serine/threonine-protein kinase
MRPVGESKGGAGRPVTPLEVARTLAAGRSATTLRQAYPAGDVPGARSESGIQFRGTGGTSEAPRPPEPLAPLARYQPIGPLGEGGMGKVDEVYDGLLGRFVARKALLAGAEEERATMLIAEAQTCAQLEHPSIVPVYDVGADEQGSPFYTMRVVRGRTLADLLEDNADPACARVPLAQVLGILRQVCLAVDYAHTRGVVHRDLKPDNVVLGEFGEVYVVDWGIAHVQEGSSVYRATCGPGVAGTPGYMAPEQLDADGVDGRADVFALGVMLYEILSGSRPFSDLDIDSVVQRRSRIVALPPSANDPLRACPSAFDQLTLACLAPDPGSRPASTRAIADAIDAFLDGERARMEREKEAAAYAAEGEDARRMIQELDAEAAAINECADSLLASLPLHAGAEDKEPAWALCAESERLSSQIARAWARAETAYTRALGRVADHQLARAGLAALYYRQFEIAEAARNQDEMARLLDLARAYDDGQLALELANQGELVVHSSAPGAIVSVAAFEARGPRIRAGSERSLGATPVKALLLDAGSYLVRARLGDRELRYPLLVQRAMRCLIELRIPEPGELPEGMVLIPGGPALTALPGAGRLVVSELADFAIGRFPVTLREYAVFLDRLPASERERRTPRVEGKPVLVREGAEGWRLNAGVIEGAGSRYVPPDRELELPAFGVRWWDAAAYARWLGRAENRAYRLPTDLEWEKAMRGADGRPFPMSNRLDPCFAKTRDSRPGPSQPEPIGSFALDESPYGVRDLAGGVGDWTCTSPDGLAPPSAEEEGTTRADDRQMFWRGGTWSSAATAGHMRYAQATRTWAAWIGFRLALSLDAHGSSKLGVEPMRKPHDVKKTRS